MDSLRKPCLIYGVLSLVGVLALALVAVCAHKSSLAAAIPVLPYALLAIGTRKFCNSTPRQAAQEYRDKDQSTILTLAGFCFTSLSLVVTFFGKELRNGDPGARGILSLFAIALGFFILAHSILRFRTKYLFFLICDGATDAGFWCMFVGVMVFVVGIGLEATLFFILLGCYLALIYLHFYNWCRLAEGCRIS